MGSSSFCAGGGGDGAGARVDAGGRADGFAAAGGGGGGGGFDLLSCRGTYSAVGLRRASRTSSAFAASRATRASNAARVASALRGMFVGSAAKAASASAALASAASARARAASRGSPPSFICNACFGRADCDGRPWPGTAGSRNASHAASAIRARTRRIPDHRHRCPLRRDLQVWGINAGPIQ